MLCDSVKIESSFESAVKLIFLLIGCTSLLNSINSLPDDGGSFDIKMPGVKPAQNDDYICKAFKVSDIPSINPISSNSGKVYLTKFTGLASADRAHHIILQKCGSPLTNTGRPWRCLHHGTCSDPQIVYAWAKNAPPTTLPDDIGFEVDVKSDYLVMQVHYKHPMREADRSGLRLNFSYVKPKFRAGVMLMYRSYLTIPPHTSYTDGDMNCKLTNEMTIFAYRTHAHALGSVITGYHMEANHSTLTEIARGDPQRPQTFYPMKNFVHAKKGDVLVARCTYNSTHRSTQTNIGGSSDDEMCNLYLMFYMENWNKDAFRSCGNTQFESLSSKVPLSSHLKVEQIEKDGLKRVGESMKGLHLSEDKEWSLPLATRSRLGQMGGVTVDKFDNVVVFHRADRSFDGNTFLSSNVYAGNRNEPISENTVLTLNREGVVINEWGKDLFFMPHMITIDSKNNVWLTDVALHQVFMFGPYGWGSEQGKGEFSDETGKRLKPQPLIKLGVAFEPGSDTSHFCKPTSIAVSDDGKSFYVADGYCNSRILKYSVSKKMDGYHVQFLFQIPSPSSGKTSEGIPTISPYSMLVPHSLALAEEKSLICVADREHGRISCFHTQTGKFIKSFGSKDELGSTVFAIDYTPLKGGRLFAVGGPEMFALLNSKVTKGYIFDVNANADAGQLLNTFNGGGSNKLAFPHDISISSDAKYVYVIQLFPKGNIIRFVTDIESTTSDEPGKILSIFDAPPSQSFPLVQNKIISNSKPSSSSMRKMIFFASMSLLSSFVVIICMIIYKKRKKGGGSQFMRRRSSSTSSKKRRLLHKLLSGKSNNGRRCKSKDDDLEGREGGFQRLLKRNKVGGVDDGGRYEPCCDDNNFSDDFDESENEEDGLIGNGGIVGVLAEDTTDEEDIDNLTDNTSKSKVRRNSNGNAKPLVDVVDDNEESSSSNDKLISIQ